MASFKSPILVWPDHTMMNHPSEAKVEVKLPGNTLPWLSQDGTDHQSFYFNSVATPPPLTYGVLAASLARCSKESRFWQGAQT
jgi:hypothetical protein